MHRMLKWILLLLITCSAAYSASNTEFRSTWVITWNYGSAGTTSKSAIRAILDRHVEANMNAVLWQVRQSGTAYYNSSYEPWGYYVGGTSPGFDPLDFALKEAHKRGLEFHAWVNCFHTSSTVNGAPAAEHPEWVCTNQDGEFMTSRRCLSPGLPEVRDYTVDVIKEIVQNYDVDGVHLDFVRWNEYDKSDMSSSLSIEDQIQVLDGHFIAQKLAKGSALDAGGRYIYDAEHPYSDGIPDGFSTWADWRRWTVTEFIKTLEQEVHALKPWVRISAAALGNYKWGGWNGYYTVFQDAALWFNEGYIDQLTPMHYHWSTPKGFHEMLVGPNGDNQAFDCWGRYIQDGIEDGRLFTVGPGSYILEDANRWNNHPDIVRIVREVPWADGFQFFSYGQWFERDYWSTAAEEFFTNQAKIRATGLMDDQSPNPPDLTVTMLDSSTYELTIQPTDESEDTGWYALYRKMTPTLDPASDEVMDIVFSDSAFTVIDTIFNGQSTEHYYGVTAIDRFWNESTPSNLYKTVPVPPYSYQPESVSLDLVRQTPNGIRIMWSFEGDEEIIKGFRLYGHRCGEEEWQLIRNEFLLRSSVRSITLDPPDNEDWFYTVRTVGKGPKRLEATNPSIMGTNRAGTRDILLVDAFDRRTGAWTQAAHPFVKNVGQSLVELNLSYDTCSQDAIIDDQVNLDDYAAVFWLAGDDNQETETIDGLAFSALTSYLRQSGQLVMSGSNIGQDLYEYGARNTKAFFSSYLMTDYVGDGEDGNGYSLSGVDGTPFQGVTLTLDDGTHGFDVDKPDIYAAPEGSEICLEYSTGGAAAIQFTGIVSSGDETARVLTLGFPFETLHQKEEMNLFLQRVTEFFELTTNTYVADHTSPALSYELYPNYPNPFNPETTIRYYLPRAARVMVTVYNIKGETIATLVDTRQTKGTHQIQWEASGYSSGIYYYRLKAESGGTTFTRQDKMIYLK